MKEEITDFCVTLARKVCHTPEFPGRDASSERQGAPLALSWDFDVRN